MSNGKSLLKFIFSIEIVFDIMRVHIPLRSAGESGVNLYTFTRAYNVDLMPASNINDEDFIETSDQVPLLNQTV